MSYNSSEILAAAGLVVVAALIVAAGIVKFRPRPLNTGHFQQKWAELSKLLGNKDTWPLAVMNADKLLDEALKKRRFRGKTMGERMVAAQRALTDNDAAWFGHKLRNRVVHEEIKLREKDVKQALIGLRQALKDLGALK